MMVADADAADDAFAPSHVASGRDSRLPPCRAVSRGRTVAVATVAAIATTALVHEGSWGESCPQEKKHWPIMVTMVIVKGTG